MERLRIMPVIVIGLALCACSGPRNLALQDALTAYELAARDPGARANAADALDEARRYLNRAQALMEKRAEPQRVEYYAVLARTCADAARSLGKSAPVPSAPERLREVQTGYTRQNVSRTSGLTAANPIPAATTISH